MTEHPVFIEVETSTFCNRTCSWCPNGHNERGRTRQYMASEVWDSLLVDLRSRGYSGWFAFHNYNEPLADPAIYRRIADARVALPDASLAIYTNGDYRKAGELERLVDEGVSEVRVTLYPKTNNENREPSWIEVETFVEECFPNAAIEDRSGPRRLEGIFFIGLTRFVIVVPRVEQYSNRAGNVSYPLLLRPFQRSGSCYLPNWAAAIDVWGNVKLCCQIYDVTDPSEAGYLMGNVGESGFFDVWTSSKMNQARERLANGIYLELEKCRRCNHVMRPQDEEAARSAYLRLVGTSKPRVEGDTDERG